MGRKAWVSSDHGCVAKRQSCGRRTERGEEPSVLAAGVAVLQDLLDGLLGILTLADLLESIGGHDALEALELESVAGGHEVVVVDDLDERLDLAALLLSRLGHAAGDLRGVPLDTSYEGMAVRVCLGAGVDGLDDDDLDVSQNISAQDDSSFFPGLQVKPISPMSVFCAFPAPPTVSEPVIDFLQSSTALEANQDPPASLPPWPCFLKLTAQNNYGQVNRKERWC